MNINEQYNYWTTLELCNYKQYNKFRMWKCRCICGTVKDVREYYLRTNASKSCGCKMQELISKKTSKHGDSVRTCEEYSRHYLYSLWSGIIQKTTNKNAKFYYNYGGRGIIMFPEWINNYIKFKEWILTHLGEKPHYGMS